MRSLIRIISLMAAHCVAISFGAAQSHPAFSLFGAHADHEEPLLRILERIQPRSDQEIQSSVLAWYRTQAFYRTSIDSIRPSESGHEIWLTEGRPTMLQSLTLSGVGGRLQRDLLNVMVQREDERFIDTVLTADIQRILEALGNEGYHGATVTRGALTEETTDDEYLLSIELIVDPGGRSVVQRMAFDGLSETRTSTAEMLSGIDPGDLWSGRMGEAARRRLTRSRIFSDVSVPSVRMAAPGRIAVNFRVTEGKPNAFDGIIGYLPPATPSESGTVTGLIDLQFGNLFGTARRLEARWYQERQSRHEIEVSYREPAIAGWPVAGELGLFQRRQDSTYVRLEGSLSLEAEVSLDMFAALTLSRSTTTPVEGYGQLVLAGSDVTFIGARFSYDTRDRPVAPMSGLFYATSLEAGRKSSSFAGITSATGIQRISFDAEFHYPTAAFQTLAVMAHWRQISGDGVDIADLYRLGGSTTLRGYRENTFIGSRLIWQTTEYRFFLSSSSYIGGFLDLASIIVSDVNGIGALDLFRAGYGITSLIDTPIGSVGLSLAMGKGDAIGDAKLHLRLRTEF